MLLLVTGCGRSGTKWASQLFGCRHESQFTPTRHGPLVESESSWLAVPYLEHLPSDTQIIRVIRNPYHVVASALRRAFLAHPEANRYGAFAVEHCPPVADAADHLGRVIRWVAHWDVPLDGYPHAVLQVDGRRADRAARQVVDGHPDGHLIHDRAERWGYA